MNVKVKEIFSSIQGEGPVVGYKQLFIRFCNCNLKCNYCDTEFDKTNSEEFSPQELYKKITSEYNLKTFHSISLTGGEPLLSAEFLKEFLSNNLEKIKNLIDIISADIKLETSTGLNTFDKHREFFAHCNGIETFAKIVFDKNITEEEIKTCAEIGNEFNIELVLQPKMIEDKMSVNSDFCNELLEKFTALHHNTRLIPQVHKFLDVR